jgi:hypothetical protein
MKMLKEAMQFLIDLRRPTEFDFEMRRYTDKVLLPVQVDLQKPIEVATLTGFIDCVGMCFDGHTAEDTFLQVEDYATVAQIAQEVDEWNRRSTFARAEVDQNTNRFTFDQFQEPESFIIGLQANFEATDDQKRLLILCQSLTSENIATAEDDGITQVAITKKGAALKQSQRIEPRVVLAPFRTFRELQQPRSEFLFRLRSREGMPPLCALFEADGGRWQIDAAKAVQEYLAEKLSAFKVVQ